MAATTKSPTTAQVRALGYEVKRGDYSGTTGNRLDRWYVVERGALLIDRSGAGHATRREALEYAVYLAALRAD